MKESNDEIPNEFICPLTLNVMKDPCMVIWGPCYEKSAIIEWLNNGNRTCPLTRKEMFVHDLVTNYALKQKIRHWHKRQEQGNDTEIDMTDKSDDSSSSSIFSESDNIGCDIRNRGLLYVNNNSNKSIFRILARQYMDEIPDDNDNIERLIEKLQQSKMCSMTTECANNNNNKMYNSNLIEL